MHPQFLAPQGGLLLVSVLVQGALVAGFVWLIYRWLSSNNTKGKRAEDELVEVKERLVATEQRLTDVQDVMIALSEKFDRWEEQAETKRGRDD